MSGKIISGKTDQPIEGATIELFDIFIAEQNATATNFNNLPFLSDKDGRFKATSVMRKMIFGLPKYKMRIIKTGYETLEIDISLKDKPKSDPYKLIES
jgi:hypothetical protein